MSDAAVMFHYGSKRSQLARLGRQIGSRNTYFTLIGVSFLLFFGGFVLATETSFGWLLASFAGPVWAFGRWGQSLRALPNGRGNALDSILETDLLARLPKDHTPKDIAKLLRTTRGGNFFTTRFMISFDFIETMLSDTAHDSKAVWQQAIELKAAHDFTSLSSPVVAVAVIFSMPEIDDYLAHLGLDRDDIEHGLAWYAHIDELISEHHARKNTGGIGRDWDFGYTPLLERFGFNISEHITYSGLLAREVQSREDTTSALIQTLSQSGRHNVALVGQLGSGKTKLVHSLAERLLTADHTVPKVLHYNQVVALDPSTLMAQVRGRGELEHLVQQLCYEALRAKNIILFFDDAQLFFEEGTGSVDLSNVLLPVLEGGALRLVLAMDEQRWATIVQRNAGLAQYLNRVVVQPTNEDETMQIMQNQAILFEHQQQVTYTFQALQAAHRLSSRFIAEQVMPGRAIKLMESAANHADQQLVTQQAVERAIEQTMGVKVGVADTSTEKETLLNLEQLIHDRMINQSRAVRVVSDALRRARAGVRNTSRPIGTFLFLGPTGVGKTELAKSIAAIFFKDESRLVRLDLNEYVRSEDVARLIADAAQDSHSLTAQISRQPFSVVLLDEIEKAHPEVLNTLLQLLDEGILRDINNREVSFRDAVIIATSNAGADKIREHIEKGEQLEQFEMQFTDELVSSNTFRPEFLNRFDEIVLFRPLEPAELKQVIDLILQGVNKTLAPQKLTVSVADDAKDLLVEAGYDPRLGARPMRRIVQRTVENIVANRVLSQQARPGETVQITRDEVSKMLSRD